MEKTLEENYKNEVLVGAARYKNEINLLKFCLIKRKADINYVSPSKGGKTALIAASEYGNVEAVMFLLENGAKVNVSDVNGMTALMMAAQRGKDKIVEALLKSGADKRLKNKEGKTALDLADEEKYSAIVKMIKGAPSQPFETQGSKDASLTVPSIGGGKDGVD